MKPEEWSCPRCGLTGDHHKTPDPERCRECCATDAATTMLKALRGPDYPNHRAVDAIVALLGKFHTCWDPAKDEDPDAVFQLLGEVEFFIRQARTALTQAEGIET